MVWAGYMLGLPPTFFKYRTSTWFFLTFSLWYHTFLSTSSLGLDTRHIYCEFIFFKHKWKPFQRLLCTPWYFCSRPKYAGLSAWCFSHFLDKVQCFFFLVIFLVCFYMSCPVNKLLLLLLLIHIHAHQSVGLSNHHLSINASVRPCIMTLIHFLMNAGSFK